MFGGAQIREAVRVNHQGLIDSTAGTPLIIMLPALQPILITDRRISLASLADPTLLPVLLERGEQPFFEWYSSIDLITSEGSMFREPELRLVGEAKLYASGQCDYSEGYRFIVAAFDVLWKRTLRETEILRATHFHMEAFLHQWQGYIGHDYGFELDTRLQGYVLKNSLS